MVDPCPLFAPPWWQWHPPVGTYIGILGVLGVIVPWLFRDGFDRREAADGGAAIERLAAGTRINLVLSNLLLPLVDGLTLRHANVSTTNTYYIKSAADDTRAAMAKLERLVIGNEASAETEQHENFEVATEAADADAAAIQ